MRTPNKLFLYIALTLAVLLAPSLTCGTGGALSAQTVGEAFYIYRNDGQFNAFFRTEIDSMAYSCYDLDSLLHDDIVTQVIYTQDSIYQIPLKAIDSISFVQPETVYKADVTPITGDLLDYVVSVDDLTLTLSPQIPTSLLPAVGDKIVSVDLKEPFPYGFLGRVVSVNQTGGGYVVKCEFIGLEEAVDRLCMTTTTATTDAGQMVKSLAPRHVVRDYTFDIGEQQQSFDLSSVIHKKDVLSVTGKAAVTATVHPVVYVQATYVVNPQVGLYTKFHIVGNTSASLDLDVAGEVSRELWKKELFSKEKHLAYGFTLYAALGAKVEASGELAVGVTFGASGRQTLDIVYCPFRQEHNDVAFNNELLSAGADWHYLAARASLKACGYLELGVGYAHHYLAKVGGEFELGAKGEYESVLDLDLLERADEETAFYEAMNEHDKVDVNAYLGAYFVAALLSGADIERLKFSKGRDWNLTPEPIFQGRSLPLFGDIETHVSSSTSATAATQLSGDLLLPQTIGLRVVDEDGTTVDTYRRDATYWNRLLSDRELNHEFTNLQKGKKYKVYPLVTWFGHDIVATPSAELDMNFPVELSDFKVTKSQYKQGEFTNDGIRYDYRFDVSVKATLEADDLSEIADWGYVYRDPNGREKEISLAQFGTSYTDTRYAYFRNEAQSTCILYGYVRYVGNNEAVYGEPQEFELKHSETSCPDANHPHWIDLGLPSGTLWRCCNEGASTPEAYGDYYTFGQVSTAPTREQIKELVENCTYQWTTVNGVNGGKFTGPNGGSIFLPAAGSRWRGEFYIRGLLGPLLVLDSLRRDTAPTDWASTRASRTGTTAAATSSNPCAQCVRTESASFRERE
ncbi:MAG: hypothetical protein IJT48_07065 [Bacteroidaceae bacterium]|nr:hypothetical protein [Bacteroidaceae bacterium]